MAVNQKVQDAKNWAIARAKEPSTWIGITGLLGVFGYHFNPSAVANIASQVGEIAIAVASAVLVVKEDKK